MPQTEVARVGPSIAALRAALPDMPLSIDTTKVRGRRRCARRGRGPDQRRLGRRADDGLLRLAAERDVPIVLMHNRAEARYSNLMAEVVADLQAAIERAVAGRSALGGDHRRPGLRVRQDRRPTTSSCCASWRRCAILGRPILLGTSRKSTLGKVLDLPPDQRVEATLATTAIGIAAGVDIVRVHDVRRECAGLPAIARTRSSRPPDPKET